MKQAPYKKVQLIMKLDRKRTSQFSGNKIYEELIIHSKNAVTDSDGAPNSSRLK